MPYQKDGATHYTREDHAAQRLASFMARLIHQWEADDLRKLGGAIAYPRGYEADAHPGLEDHGVLKIASGRARCRSCGEKIRKGSYAIKFLHDFTGCGSWTVVECWIHAERCTSKCG